MIILKKTRKSYPRKDVTGQKFGKLTAIEWLRGGRWRCICDCGNETIIDTRKLLSGHTTSCGCNRYESKNVVDMIGYEDENIKVLERANNIGKTAAWKCLCKHCGNTFITSGSNIRFGFTQSCRCIHSNNEKIITKLLLENNIDFETQYTFPDLNGVGGRPLKFDFAIFNNGELKRLVEFNGIQHYERPKGSWADGYETLLEHDRRKIEYCNKNNIELKIISYKDKYNLTDIID